NDKLKNDIHYFIFDQKNNLIIDRGSFDAKNSAQSLRVELPFGEYSTATVYNNSVNDPFFPEVINAKNDFYLRDSMGLDGRIFGSIDTFKVNRSFSQKIALRRAYSQIRFEFTDAVAPSRVTQLRVYPAHHRYTWNPFFDCASHGSRIQTTETLFNRFQCCARENGGIQRVSGVGSYGKGSEI